VWADGRFSNFTHEDIAFSMSTDGGKTWSDPIKVNQTPTTIPAGDQQAFTPSVAVNSDGTVAVTYYDFRNPDSVAAGLPTDYWLVHASRNFTDPTSWAANELRLTTASFNMENAAPTSRGYFLGDYQALAAAGQSFYALFAQAGAHSSNPSDIWFRDPPPAAGGGDAAGAADAGVPASPAAVGPQDSVGAPLVGGLTDALAPVGGDFGSAAARFLLSPADPATVPLSAGEGGMKAPETPPPPPAAAWDGATAPSAASRNAAHEVFASGASDAASADPGDGLPQDPLANADDV
jgi:hypothetical protein